MLGGIFGLPLHGHLYKKELQRTMVLQQEPFINSDMGILKYHFMAFLNHILNATIKHSG